MFSTIFVLFTAVMVVIAVATPTKLSGRQFLDLPNVPAQCNSTDLSCQGLPVNTSACCSFDSIFICNQTHQWFIIPCPFATVCVGGGNSTLDTQCFGPGDGNPLACMSSLPHFLEDLLRGFSTCTCTCSCSWSNWYSVKDRDSERDFGG
jgi:hypothetical protein